MNTKYQMKPDLLEIPSLQRWMRRPVIRIRLSSGWQDTPNTYYVWTCLLDVERRRQKVLSLTVDGDDLVPQSIGALNMFLEFHMLKRFFKRYPIFTTPWEELAKNLSLRTEDRWGDIDSRT